MNTEKRNEQKPEEAAEEKTLVSEGAGFAPANNRTGGGGTRNVAAVPAAVPAPVLVRDMRRAVRLHG